MILDDTSFKRPCPSSNASRERKTRRVEIPPTLALPVHLLGADTAGADGQPATDSHADTSQGTITTPKKTYRPPLTSLYQPPNLGPDLLENTDWLFQGNGQALLESNQLLPPRDDIIQFDPGNDLAEFDRNFQPQHCPQHLQAQVKDIVKEYWDVFCEKGL